MTSSPPERTLRRVLEIRKQSAENGIANKTCINNAPGLYGVTFRARDPREICKRISLRSVNGQLSMLVVWKTANLVEGDLLKTNMPINGLVPGNSSHANSPR